MVISTIVAVLFSIYGSVIFNWITAQEDLPFKKWIVVYLLFGPVTVITEMIYMLYHRPDRIVYYTHWIYNIQLVLIVIAIVGVGTVHALVIAITIWVVIKILWLLSVLRTYADWTVDSTMIKVFGLFSLPLILQFVISHSASYVDGIIVNYYFEESQFPVFRYGAKELPITTILVVSMASAMIPLAVTHLQDTLVAIKRRTRIMMHYLFPLSAILILISPLLFKRVYSAEYVLSAQIFNVYLLILISRILVPHIIMLSQKKNVPLLVFAIIELAVNVGLSILWASQYGLVGVAFATLVANLAHTMMMITYNAFVLSILPYSYIDWKPYLSYSLLLVCAFVLSYQIHY